MLWFYMKKNKGQNMKKDNLEFLVTVFFTLFGIINLAIANSLIQNDRFFFIYSLKSSIIIIVIGLVVQEFVKK